MEATQEQAPATTTPRIQRIVSRWDSTKVLFECELPADIDAGLAMRHALEKATAARTYLRGAYLRDAYLRGAYLRDADLGGAYLGGADLRDAYLGGADLRDAYLGGADLRDADLRGADLRDAYLGGAASPEQAVANLDRVREIILDDAERLRMDAWHADDSWKDRTCAEETLCGTTHCLAGWLQVCSTDEKIRTMRNTHLAGILSAPVASSMFFVGESEALEWLRDRKYAQPQEAA